MEDVRVGDEVKVAPGLSGRVEQVVTDRPVMDPLTIEPITGTKEDPAVLVVTDDGVSTVVLVSELEEHKAAPVPVPEIGEVVAWPGGTGVVDLLVDAGQVPGVAEQVVGTKRDPYVRVRTTVRGEDGQPELQRLAVKAADLLDVVDQEVLERTPAAGVGAGGLLVELLAAHETRVEAKGLTRDAVPTGRAVKAVFDRGTASWPGQDITSLTAEQWGAGRVKAFLAVAAGEDVAGYTHDRDLLPATG